MALNKILPFAPGVGANVLSDVDYAADGQLVNGQVPGIARSAFNNKALRQATAIAAAVAQMIAANQANDVDDSQTTADLTSWMYEAIRKIGIPTAVATGTADALLADFGPNIALVDGQTVAVRAASANATTTPTLNADGLGAKTIVKGANSALVAGEIGGAGHWLVLTYDLTLDKWVLSNPLAVATSVKQIQTISATVAASALTVGLAATSLDFRSNTLGSGVVNTRAVGAISLVVPSGATLGTTNAVASRLMVLAIDNAGTVELAIVNRAGGNDLSETGVISTTALSAASDVANVIYSTTARANVPYRVVGFVESTQATAGTWATAPSKIQGSGGDPTYRNIAQVLTSYSGSLNSGGGKIPWDDTIPQNTEGTEFYSVTITPTDANSLLEIDANIQCASSVVDQLVAALFKDSEANARAAAVVSTTQGAGQPGLITIKYFMVAGSTAATTFKLRAGGVVGDITVNGTSLARRFGGAGVSGISVKEYTP